MPGPWEKYAQAPSAGQGQADAQPSEPSGPWSKYAQPAPAKEPGMFDGTGKAIIDSLPAIGGVVGGALGTPADVVAGPMGNVVGAAVGGYVGTAAKNLINKYIDPDSAPKNMTEVMTQPIVGGAEQGAMQGAGEIAAPYISKAVGAVSNAGSKVAKWAGTKILSNLGGVSPDVIKEYSQFSDRINSAPSVDALKEISDNFVSKLSSDVEAKKITAEQAQEAYKGLQSDIKDAYKTAGYDARDAVTSAQQTLKDAHTSRLQQLSGDLYDTVNKLKADVRAGSGQALETLNKSNAQVDLKPVYSQIDSTINSLKQAGTDEALGVADKLDAYKARLLQQNPDKIPAPLAKKLVQGLDQITEYSPMAGSFDKAKNAAFKGVRSALDDSLKSSVPEYAKAMEPVAANAGLLNRVSDFGDRQQAVNLLQRVNAPNQLESKAALQELGNKYGVDFINAAKPESLPEYKFLNNAQAMQDALRPDRVADKIDQALASSRQKSALDAAQSGLNKAQSDLAPFKPLAPNAAGQTTAQQKLMQLGKGKNIELEDMFQKLGKLSDTDFVQAMKDNNIKAAFEKGATNGSRNTMIGAVVGWASGGVGGAAVGASAGRVADQWGPAITKKVLDASIAVSKSPTMATISSLDLPAPIKKNMIVGLENYLANGARSASEMAGPAMKAADNESKQNRSPARGEDKWAQDGAAKLGIQDPDLLGRLTQSKQGKSLLIQASDLSSGSAALEKIRNQIKKGWQTK